MTDQEMIRRYAVDGCQEAFSELVQRHSDTVYSVCLHVLGDRIAAEDATQAAFLVLARRARSVAGGKVVAGWLITTARNCALNMKKAAARRNRIERETLMHRSQPELSVINDEMRKVIHEAIASLPAQQRNVVILRYLQNRTQAETAVELNCAEHSVSAALSKALARLQQKLSHSGVSLSALLPVVLSQGFLQIAPAETVSATISAGLGKTSATTTAIQTADSVMRGLLLTRIKVGLAALLLLGLISASLVIGADGADKKATRAGSDPVTQRPEDEGPERLVLQTAHSTEAWRLHGQFSPDGKYLATWDMFQHELRIWTGEKYNRLVFAAEEAVSSVAFAHDSRSFVTLTFATRNAIKHRALPSGKTLTTVDAPGCHQNEAGIFFAFDDNHVAANGPDLTAKVWQLDSGAFVPLEVEDSPAPVDRTSAVGIKHAILTSASNGSAVAVLPDESYRVNPIRICDARTGMLLRTCERKRQYSDVGPQKKSTYASLHSNSDGTFIIESRYVSGESGIFITVWDSKTGQEIVSHAFDDRRISFGAFGGATHLLLRNELHLCVWDWQKPDELEQVATPEQYASVLALSPDGSRAVVGCMSGAFMLTFSGRKFQPMNLADRNCVLDVIAVAPSPGGQLLATSGSPCNVAVWDLLEAKLVDQFKFGQPSPGSSWRNWLRFSANGAKMNIVHARTQFDRCTWEFGSIDLQTGALRTMNSIEDKASLQQMQFNDEFALIAEIDKLRRFDLEKAVELPAVPLASKETIAPNISLPQHSAKAFLRSFSSARREVVDLTSGQTQDSSDPIDSAEYSPDGNYALYRCEPSDRQAPKKGQKTSVTEVRRLRDNAKLAELPDGFDYQFESTSRRFCYLADSGIVVGEIIGGNDDKIQQSVRQINVLPLELCAPTRGWSYSSSFGYSHFDVRLLPGGKAIVFGQNDCALMVDVETGKEVARFRAFQDKSWLITTPDALYTGSEDIEARLTVAAGSQYVASATKLKEHCRPEDIKKRLREYVRDSKASPWTAVTAKPNAPPPVSSEDF